MTLSNASSSVPSRPRRHLLLVAACLLAGGCETLQAIEEEPVVFAEEAPPPQGWRAVMQPDDFERLMSLEQAWAAGLEAARRGGFARRVAAEGALLAPEAALPRATLPPGSYRCRLIRLGRTSPRGRPLTARGPFFCHVGVEGEMLSLTQQTGAERPGGYLWPDQDMRMIFIGAAAIGREDVPPPYGEEPERDVVGAVERVGPFRYRMAMPQPASGADIEVLELVPAVQ